MFSSQSRPGGERGGRGNYDSSWNAAFQEGKTSPGGIFTISQATSLSLWWDHFGQAAHNTHLTQETGHPLGHQQAKNALRASHVLPTQPSDEAIP